MNTPLKAASTQAPTALSTGKLAKTLACISISAFLLFPLTGCTTVARPGDDWLGRDKFHHFWISGLVAGTGTALAQEQDQTDKQAIAIGFGISMALGAAKEAYDSRKGGTGWSWQDLCWDFSGALIGCTIAHAVTD